MFNGEWSIRLGTLRKKNVQRLEQKKSFLVRAFVEEQQKRRSWRRLLIQQLQKCSSGCAWTKRFERQQVQEMIQVCQFQLHLPDKMSWRIAYKGGLRTPSESRPAEDASEEAFKRQRTEESKRQRINCIRGIFCLVANDDLFDSP